MLYTWWDQLDIVYFELLQLRESVTADIYPTQISDVRKL